ncbi:MAG TPA: type VI secretion system membrane subunit TssM [Gammaproteobacteria bacterium]|nr:type VI secretion system membrane subunit TssM [Gammaproteobacteria bacterium]
MNPLKTLHNYNPLSRMKPLHKQIATRALISFSVVSLFSAAIWFLSPSLVVHGQAAFAPPQKRLYVIVAFYLLWLLKLLILDFDVPKTETPVDETTQQALDHLLKRFQGALSFMQSTTIAKHGHPTPLKALPWYLIIGPENAGKTALLANANVNYILQRQFSAKEAKTPSASSHCDWWVTRDACLVDIPGKYIEGGSPLHSKLWSALLNLIKSSNCHEQCSGIILTLPLPELMKANNAETLNQLVLSLKRRLENLQHAFQRTLPCVLVITKCDLLPGFNEYFSESADDEITQAWGITLPYLRTGDRVDAIFSLRFNALIKKLNQQLIWRLHQERNPMIRPPIKDFPLQVERLKTLTQDLLRKLTKTTSAFQLHALYLTSALQTHTDTSNLVLDEHESERALQAFKAPTPSSRPYFIKQLLTYGLSMPPEAKPVRARLASRAKRKLTYATSALLVIAATLQLGHDFEHGIKRSQAIQKHLATYELSLKSFQNPNDTLVQTVNLLNGLQASVQPEKLAFDLKGIFKFYTHQSDQKAALIYHEALQAILLPEVGNVLADALNNPVNRDQNQVYRLLQAYLMLNDPQHANANIIQATVADIANGHVPAETLPPLRYHLSLALAQPWKPVRLNQKTIVTTQNYLNAMPTANLAYLIIKNQSNTANLQPITLDAVQNNPELFTLDNTHGAIPALFTANSFNTVMTQDSQIAAHDVAHGNWVLGVKPAPTNNTDDNTLLAQLRTAYVTDYVHTWENELNAIHLTRSKDLAQLDAMLTMLTSDHSPLVNLITTVHNNTYFEPVTTLSPTLYALGQTQDSRMTTTAQLTDIMQGLQALHAYLQPVVTSHTPRKAAYDLVAERMMHQGAPDPITNLRLLADKSPEPLKSWLNQLTNESWHDLSQTAIHYIDTSWKEEVSHAYEQNIAHHYPFQQDAKAEVALHQFTQFFGNPGVIPNFYNHYLAPFVDTSSAEWRWKKSDDLKLPFSDESLRDIQQAVRIHHAFFPKGDNQLLVQFQLQPYEFGKDIKTVALNINNSQLSDMKTKIRTPHVLMWPGRMDYRMSSLDLTLKDEAMIHSDFPGTWGWLKLISQSYESPISQKQILLNFSQNKTPVKYVLSTNGQFNPLITLSLYHFRLPAQLITA